MNIILASESPARKALLARLGIDFAVIPANIDEAGLIRERGITAPAEHVLALCEAKARFVHEKATEPCVIIAADTVIFHNGKILEKPIDLPDAFNMLKSLQGQTHEVYTGVAIMHKQQQNFFCDTSIVRMRPLDDSEISAYVNTGEPLGRSGSYSISGLAALLIDHVNGDVNSVVGLPLARTCAVLKEMGINLLEMLGSVDTSCGARLFG